MSIIQTVSITSTIFLFIMGAWPIAFITTIIFVVVSIINTYKKNQNAEQSEIKQLQNENQELKAEIQKLRQELAEQAVQRAMDKAENRERSR